MKKINIRLLKFAWFLPGILTAFILSACQQQSDDVPTDTDTGDYRTYHIDLVASLAGGFSTRAITPDNSYTQEGTAAENAINPNDYKILLFDGDGKYFMEFNSGDWSANVTDDGIQIAGSFKEHPSKVPDELQLMFLANWKTEGFSYRTADANYPTAENGNLLTIQNICYSSGTSGSYRVGSEYRDNPFLPDATKCFIPMFGLSKKMAVNEPELNFSGNNSVILLRSLAKIEIIDNLKSYDYPIAECSVTGYNYWGRFTPDINVLNSTLDGVTSISIISNPSFRSNYIMTCTKEYNDETGISKFFVYIPEMDVNNNTLTINFNSIYLPSKTLNLKDYTSQILRNHIYRFVISDPKPEPEPEPDPEVSFWVYPWTTAKSTDITFD